MNYETLKRRMADDVAASVLRATNYGGIDAGALIAAVVFDAIAERRPVRESSEALAAECRRIVMNWDIRCVGKLRELFPTSFPRSLRSGPLLAEFNDGGDWVVSVDSPSVRYQSH